LPFRVQLLILSGVTHMT